MIERPLNNTSSTIGVIMSSRSVSPELYRTEMRKLAGACTIIAVKSDGEYGGLTATAVCSVSADPPSMLVCINKATWAHDKIRAAGALSVNVLASGQIEQAKRFAQPTNGNGTKRFDREMWQETADGVPVLSGSMSTFVLKVTNQMEFGTHTIFLGEVSGVRSNNDDQQPLLYFDQKFTTVTE